MKKKIKTQVIDISKLKSAYEDASKAHNKENVLLVLIPLIEKKVTETDVELGAYLLVRDPVVPPFLIDVNRILSQTNSNVDIDTPRISGAYYINSATIDGWLTANVDIKLIPSQTSIALAAGSGSYTANGTTLFPSPPATS
jgi:hypothetical protein